MSSGQQAVKPSASKLPAEATTVQYASKKDETDAELITRVNAILAKTGDQSRITQLDVFRDNDGSMIATVVLAAKAE